LIYFNIAWDAGCQEGAMRLATAFEIGDRPL